MRVCLSTFGSRGDIQPLVALAAQLQTLGADVRVCAPHDPEFVELAARGGVPLAPAFSPVREWVKDRMNRKATDLREAAAEVMAGQLGAITAAAEGCDVLLATGVFSSTAVARSVAEKQGIRYIYASYCPLYLPSPHHRPVEYPGRPYPPEVTDNATLWQLNLEAMKAFFGEAFRAQRASMGLPAVANIRDHVFTDRPWLAADPVLGPWQPAPLEVVQTGAWLLPDERPLPRDLAAFLDSGTPPVYVGFGSMPQHTLKAVAQITIETIRALGCRVLVHHGWAEIAPSDDRDNCFAIGEVNHQILFPRVAAVIHHGGAGTTATAARAGVPQVIVPQVADQPYWGRRVTDLGLGAVHAGPVPSTESLLVALQMALDPATRARAAVVAGTIRGDGTALAAKQLLEQVS